MIDVEGLLFHGFARFVLAGNSRLAALARHTIVAGATIKHVPGHGKGEVRVLVDNS